MTPRGGSQSLQLLRTTLSAHRATFLSSHKRRWAHFVPPALIDRNGARAEVRKSAGRISAGLPSAGYLWAAQKLEFLGSTAYTIAHAVFSLTFS